jgi:hypothetical protein
MTLQVKAQNAKSNLLFGLEKFIFWQRWLLIFSLLLVDLGLYMAFLKGTIYFALFDNLINPVFWASTMAPASVAGFQEWIYGVLGATLAGWGTFLAFMAYYPFKQKEKWAWNCILAGVLVWYLPDTFTSLQFGVYFNAVGNTVLFILLMLPLLFTRKDFQ